MHRVARKIREPTCDGAAGAQVIVTASNDEAYFCGILRNPNRNPNRKAGLASMMSRNIVECFVGCEQKKRAAFGGRDRGRVRFTANIPTCLMNDSHTLAFGRNCMVLAQSKYRGRWCTIRNTIWPSVLRTLTIQRCRVHLGKDGLRRRRKFDE